MSSYPEGNPYAEIPDTYYRLKEQSKRDRRKAYVASAIFAIAGILCLTAAFTNDENNQQEPKDPQITGSAKPENHNADSDTALIIIGSITLAASASSGGKAVLSQLSDK